MSFEEFVDMLEREKRKQNDYELEQFFKVYDSDKKGYISAERLKRTLDNMGEPVTLQEAQAMVNFADLDRDGQVSLQDFLSAFHQD